MISTPASISMAVSPRTSNSASRTGVSVGPLRARFVAACAPMVRDVVIAGINRDEISALVVLDLDGPPPDQSGAARGAILPRRGLI